MICEKHGHCSVFCRSCDLDTVDIDWLQKRLTPELEIYTVVRMARHDLKQGDLDSAVARLRVDVDKLRCHDVELAAWVTKRAGT